MKFLKSAVCIAAMLFAGLCASAQDNPYPEENDEETAAYALTVTFSGQKPGINDFVRTLLTEPEDEHYGALSEMWERHQKNKPEKNEKVTVDAKNGFVSFESSYPEDNSKSITEICYWNSSDSKHKVIGESVKIFQDGKPVQTEFTGIFFYVYNNQTHKMTYINWHDMGANVDAGENVVTYSLPRVGKDITAVVYEKNGKTKSVVLKWNGLRFDVQK